MKRLAVLALGVLFGVAGLPTFVQASPVALDLALIVDVSGSIDPSEFALQKTGYVNAFQNPTIQNLIATTPNGIAVTLVYWSGAGQQTQAVGWMHLTDAASCNAFAAAISGTSRPFSGLTAPGSAINFTVPLFGSSGFQAGRNVIDVSGDGAANDGANTLAARNSALSNGINQINGLPILGEPGLLAFYQNDIQGGPGSFTTPAASFNDFEAALAEKLAHEITNDVPEPITLGVFGFGALVAGAVYRRQKKAVA